MPNAWRMRDRYGCVSVALVEDEAVQKRVGIPYWV